MDRYDNVNMFSPRKLLSKHTPQNGEVLDIGFRSNDSCIYLFQNKWYINSGV